MNLLVSDFDGTLHTSESQIKINIKRIEDFIKNGNIFMLSSGRSYNSLISKVRYYDIPYNYLATEDGSHMFDNDGNVVYEDNMNKSIVEDIKIIESLNKHKKIQYGTTYEYYNDDIGLPISSINFVIDEQEINDALKEKWQILKNKYKNKYEFLVYGYAKEYYFCIKDKGIDKKRPVEELSKILNLNNEQIFTIGDGDNDMPMIMHYNGYMIGNNESLKKVALKCYNEVYELIDDIEKQKVKRR